MATSKLSMVSKVVPITGLFIVCGCTSVLLADTFSNANTLYGRQFIKKTLL